MTTISFKFDTPVDVTPLYLDGVEIQFDFSFIDSEYIDTPRQSSKMKRSKIVVQASRSFLDSWSLEGEHIKKVLFQIARERISSTLDHNGSLPNVIQHKADTSTHPGPCPFDTKLLENPAGTIFQLVLKRRMGFV